MWKWTVAIALSSASAHATNDVVPVERIRFGKVVVTTRIPTLHTEIIRGEDYTVYAVTLLGNGNKTILQISKRGVVKELFPYKGWPYILDKSGRIFALSVSQPALRPTKRDFVKSMLRHIPYALATGGAVVGAGELLTLLQSTGDPGGAFWPKLLMGMGGFYAVDGARMYLAGSRRHLGGSNLFTYPIAEGIEGITWQPPGDYLLKPKRMPSKGTPALHISDLAPAFASTRECFFTLTGITQR